MASDQSASAVERDGRCMAALVSVVTRTDEPALEFPDGSVLQLDVFVEEWTHEHPTNGETVDMTTSVECDDRAWWYLTPEREGVGAPTPDQGFPKVEIEPRGVAPDDTEGGGS